MKTATLADITQEQFDAAVQTVTAGIKSANARLDTRRGTVLRELLVNPEAQLEALARANSEIARRASSLKLMKEAEDAGTPADAEDVEAVMANFNISAGTGRAASGTVKITVSDPSSMHSVPAGFKFSTADGVEFAADSAVNAADAEVAASLGNTLYTLYSVSDLVKGASGYFFLVPVKCLTLGAEGNIPQGTGLAVSSSIPGFVSAEAYKSFDGGSDAPGLAAAIARIPSSLSMRGFSSRAAIEGMLRDRFDGGDHPIVAVEEAGYGCGVQRRDKHNLFGVGVGGRVDVYVRNFGDLYTVTKTVRGTKVEDGRYALSLSPSDFPGSCYVKSVSDYGGESEEAGRESVLSGLEFSAVRTAEGASASGHDFDLSADASEAANTIWQGFSVLLSGVAPDLLDAGGEGGGGGGGGGGLWSEERDFKVTACCLPQAGEIQAYLDDESVRSVATDIVARCPFICNVTVSASVRYDLASPMDEGLAKARIRAYVNGLGFVGRLTRSEIVHVLKGCGAASVDLTADDMLRGVLHDALGGRRVLSGDALDVASIADDRAMIGARTVVFAAEPQNIQLRMTPA